jgi:hypothetical protein
MDDKWVKAWLGYPKKNCKKSNGSPSIEDVLKNLMVHSYLFFIVSWIHTLFKYYYMQIIYSLNKFKDSQQVLGKKLRLSPFSEKWFKDSLRM